MSDPFAPPQLPPPPRIVGPGSDPNAAERAKAAYILQIIPGFAFIQAVVAIIGFILSWWAVSLEVFIRRDFGERYFSFTRLFMGFTVMATTASGFQLGAMNSPSLLERYGGYAFFQVLYFGYAIAALIHWGFIQWRAFRGIPWYSMSFGRSWLSLLPFANKVDDWVLYRWVEPGIFIVLGYIMTKFNGTASAGWWILIAAIALFLKNRIAYGHARNLELDSLDAEIIAENIIASRRGAPTKDTSGFKAVRLPFALDKNRDGIPDPAQGQSLNNRPDFSKTLNETLGRTAPTVAKLPSTAPPASQEDDTRPFESAAPMMAQAGNGAAQPLPALHPMLVPYVRYWPFAAGGVAVLLLLILVLVLIGRIVPSAPDIAPGNAPAGIWTQAQCNAATECTRIASLKVEGKAQEPETWCLTAHTPTNGLVYFTATRSKDMWLLEPQSRAVMQSECSAIVEPSEQTAVALSAAQASSSVIVEPTNEPTVEPAEALVSLSPTEQPTVAPTEIPTEMPTDVPTEVPTLQPTDVPLVVGSVPAERISMSASNTAPNGVDYCQQQVSYIPDNLKDGDPTTAWRVLGDGVNASLRLTFDAPVQVTEVRIFPGYGKKDPCPPYTDRWPQGYRASSVTFTFSDGTTSSPYPLADAAQLQSIVLAQPVTTEWLEITIRETRPPLQAGAPRDYAAISDVAVIGGQQP